MITIIYQKQQQQQQQHQETEKISHNTMLLLTRLDIKAQLFITIAYQRNSENVDGFLITVPKKDGLLVRKITD